MRMIAGPRLAFLLALALSMVARAAMASEAQRAVDEANVALATRPPQRDAARGALERATTAADDPAAVSEAYFRLGALDEDDEAYSQAVTHYRQSVTAGSGGSAGRWARNAASRMQWLGARAEGDFAPLVRLHRFQRDSALAADPEAIAALARDAEAFPPGLVRAESRVLVATAWLGPLHRPRDAAGVFRLVATDPTAGGTNLRFAERGLVDALIADGQVDEAANEARTHAGQLESGVVSRLQRFQRRRTVLRVAEVEVAVFVGFAIARAYLRRRRRTSPEAARATWTAARVAGALWGAATLIVAAFLLIGAVAPSYLDRIGF